MPMIALAKLAVSACVDPVSPQGVSAYAAILSQLGPGGIRVHGWENSGLLALKHGVLWCPVLWQGAQARPYLSVGSLLL